MLLDIMPTLYAGMAELVDALDSKSSEGNFMGVRFPLPAPALLNDPVHCCGHYSGAIFVIFRIYVINLATKR
jgi:hypothetical protein